MRLEKRSATMSQTEQSSENVACDERSTRIVAESMFRDMKAYGLPNERILEIASRLIGLVTSDIKSAPSTTRRAS